MKVPGATLRVPMPPPALAALALGAALLLDRLWPVSLGLEGLVARLTAAAACFVPAAALGAWALRTLGVLGTSPDFGREVSRLATVGPYRFSRNPLYVALLLAFAGVACALDSAATACLVLGLALALDRGVVAREERFLEARFGTEYTAYRQRVRRWL